MPLDFKISPQEAEARMQVQATLRNLLSFDCDLLSRKGDVGKEWAFDDIIPYAKDAINILRNFDADAVFWAPASIFSSLQGYVEQLETAFNRVMQFTSTMDQARNHREELLNLIPTLRDRIYRDLLPAVSFLTQQRQNPSSITEKLSEVTAEVAAAKQKILSSEQEASRILSEIRDASGEKGVAAQAIVFEEEAKKHEKSAESSRNATLLLGLVLVVLAVGAYNLPVPHTGLEAAHSVATKAIFFGALVYLFTLSARNFMSHKHNSIVNQQRHNALSVYRLLADAGHSPEERSIILSRAAECIFGQQETGYAKAESAPVKTIEVSPKIGGAS